MLNISTPIHLDGWVVRLGEARIPVLRRSVEALLELMRREDEIVARDISNVILRDPMLTLSVLRTLQSLSPNRKIAEITTIEHGIMMMGVSPFFRKFQNLPIVEDLLDENPVVLRGFMGVTTRAQHAALQARNWAALRSDIESDEIAIAALLHDMAELLIWFFEPRLAIEIADRTKSVPMLRSAAVQQEVLGVKLSELQLALCREWQLPGLLQSLMDEHQVHRPRVRNALLAVAFARHSAHGWWDEELPDDLAEIENLLGLPGHEVKRNIYWVELAAITDQQCQAASDVATWLPPAPLFFRHYSNRLSGAQYGFDPELLQQTLHYLSSPVAAGLAATCNHAYTKVRNIGAIDTIACAMNGIHTALGFERVLFLDVDDGGTLLVPRYIVGGRIAGSLRELHFSAPDNPGLDGLLRQMRNATEITQLRAMLAQLLPVEACGRNPAEQYMALPLLNDSGQCRSLIYADCLSPHACGDEEIFTQFRNVVMAAEKRTNADHAGRASFKR
ncbi:MAG: HDOD domain-containing protein [Georgfuchsia sp.]